MPRMNTYAIKLQESNYMNKCQFYIILQQRAVTFILHYVFNTYVKHNGSFLENT